MNTKCNNNLILKKNINKSRLKSNPHDFIAAGVCCFILSLLDNLGLVDKILENHFLDKNEINTFPNPLVLSSALITLEKNKILTTKDDKFFLTELGSALLDNRGSIGLIYGGYRQILADQMKCACSNSNQAHENVDWGLVAKASIHFGKKAIDPIVISFIQSLQLQGSICDLGCGTALRLKNLCDITKLKGVGIELSEEVVQIANKTLNHRADISIRKGDITKIDEIFPDVEVLMQFFAIHDITPTEKCIDILSSYHKNFPNLKYFLYCDIVAPSNSLKSQLPGCDYIHSLMGIRIRTYEETVDIFKRSDFEIDQEIYIPNTPNTILWILRPLNKELID